MIGTKVRACFLATIPYHTPHIFAGLPNVISLLRGGSSCVTLTGCSREIRQTCFLICLIAQRPQSDSRSRCPPHPPQRSCSASCLSCGPAVRSNSGRAPTAPKDRQLCETSLARRTRLEARVCRRCCTLSKRRI